MKIEQYFSKPTIFRTHNVNRPGILLLHVTQPLAACIANASSSSSTQLLLNELVSEELPVLE
ncbi:unnamed protein product, partial [Callosobruchus maculatus]